MSNINVLKITIEGFSGSGKTTLKWAVLDCLERLGINATVSPYSAEFRDEEMDNLKETWLDAVKWMKDRGTVVIVETKQVNRTSENMRIY